MVGKSSPFSVWLPSEGTELEFAWAPAPINYMTWSSGVTRDLRPPYSMAVNDEHHLSGND